MIFGLDMAAGAGFLMLASTGLPGCGMAKAPHISINPVTKDVKYNFDVSTVDLTKIKTDTVNPYGANVDTTTGGLRHDKPELKAEVMMGTTTYSNGMACLWYETVNVTITLQPQIYVAKEFNKGACRDEILKHELRHVQVDREVINRHSQQIGKAIQAVVNFTGVKGPMPKEKLVSEQQRLMRQVSNAVKAYQPTLEKDMRHHQGMVDTRVEYDRIGKICDER